MMHVASTVMAFLLVTPGAGSTAGASREDELRAVLAAFARPGADHAALTARLRPTKADYAAVFLPDAAAKAQAGYDVMWASGAFVLKVDPARNVIHVTPTSTDDVKAWTPAAQRTLPGGYRRVGAHLKPGLTVYTARFVEPGKELGLAIDGLVHVNGSWRAFPKPWRVLDPSPSP